MKKLFLIIICIGLSNVIFGQIFSTVKTVPTGDVLGLPIIRLNSNDQLHVSFDEITSDIVRTLEYRFVLANADWTPSDLRPIQYISGINRFQIDDISFSLNTIADYTHYRFSFPDERTRFLVSGNFKAEIFDANDPETVLLTIHFFVTEQAVTINANVIPPRRVELRRTHQQLEFDVTSRGFDISQPHRNLTVLVQQNRRTDNVRRIQPQHISGRTLRFADSQELIFEGGNEFRNFDTQFLNFNGHGVGSITTLYNNHYFVQLLPDESRSRRAFMDNGDINGRYVVRADRRQNPEIEAEYKLVEFSLLSPFLGEHRTVHVFGELTNWAIGEHSQMEYDFENNRYVKRLFLKQGWYDYQYVVFDRRTQTIDVNHFEGSHQITRNNYTIYVYYRGMSDRHDRLIGVTTVRANE